jgi:phosphoribosyl 1,2-cyclic phosphodiesterase
LAVETIPTAHDAVDGVAFVIDDGRRRLGILTDLGHVFDGLEEVVSSLHAVILESNYDPDMLDGGAYPEFLKQRIRGPEGHISNVEAAELLACSGRRLQWACLAHLSEKNNQPKVARRTHRELLCNRFPIHIASRYEATDVLEV